VSDIPTFFKTSHPDPDELVVSNAIARLIDGLGYRLYWALHGLKEEECQYILCDGAPSIKDILWHILGLVNWVYMHVYGQQMTRKPSIIDQGIDTLLALEKLYQTFLQMSDDELAQYKLEERSFWSYINMPLADALHHVGQVSILRRGAGNPVAKERD
jgi:uncharacterized damage-inducible protein DinB